MPPDVHAQVDPSRRGLVGRRPPRISMVLSVLGGTPIADVAAEWDVLPSLLHRWVADFLVAGSSAITNRPEPDATRQRDRFMVALRTRAAHPHGRGPGWAMTLADGGLSAHRANDSLERLLDALTRLSEHIVDVELAATSSLGLMQVRFESVAVADLARELPGSPASAREPVSPCAPTRLLGRVLRDLEPRARRLPRPDLRVRRRSQDGVVGARCGWSAGRAQSAR